MNPAGKNEQMQAQEDIEKNTTLAFRAPEQVDLHSGKVQSETLPQSLAGCCAVVNAIDLLRFACWV